MAQVKISNLPNAPQNWNLTDVLAVVDSGSTTTSKQTIEYLFGNWSGQTVSSSNQYFMAANGTGAGKITIGSSNRTAVMSSEAATTSGSVDLFIAASREDGGNSISTQSLEGCAALGTKGSMSFQTSAGSVILGSWYCNSQGNENTFHLGSNSIDILGNVYKGGTIASNGGTLNNSQNAVIMACQSSDLNLAGGNTGVVIGSYSSQNYNYGSSARATGVWGSGNSKVYAKNFVNNVFGSFNSDVNDNLYSATGTRVGTIVGGYNSNIENQNTTAVVTNQAIFNAYNSNIRGSVLYTNTILGADNSLISGNSYNTIINSEGVQHIDKSGSTSIGVMDGTDAIYDDTVHMGAIHNYGARSGKVINGGSVSGTVDVDGSLGEMFEFTMTGNTAPNFINLREGQKFLFAIYNNTYSVTAATINGVSGNVLAKGGGISPSNNGWSYYTGWYDGTRVYLIEENNLSAV